jgi:hypothetical protein
MVSRVKDSGRYALQDRDSRLKRRQEPWMYVSIAEGIPIPTQSFCIELSSVSHSGVQ